MRLFRPVIESLPSRIVPAVTATLKAGVLTVSGSDAADEVTISQPAGSPSGQIAVFDTVTTQTFSGVRSIIVDLKNGDDQLTVAGGTTVVGSLTILAGAGDNTIDLTAANIVIGGTLTIRADIGEDLIQVGTPTQNVTVGGQLLLDAGLGSLTGHFFGTVVGSASIRSNGGGLEPTTFTVTGTFGQSLTIRTADGNDTLGITARVRQGRLIVQTGNGTDSVELAGQINGPVDVQHGNGTNTFRSTAGLTVGQSLRFTGGADSDEFELANATIGGSLTLVMGTGTAKAQIGTTTGSVRILGGLTYSGNLGVQTVSLRSVSVLKTTAITLGEFSDTLRIDDSRFGGAFRADTGTGNDQVLIEREAAATGITTFVGQWTVQLGDGNDTLSLGSNGDPQRRVVFRGRARGDGGAGTNTLHADNVDSTLALAPPQFVLFQP